MKISIKQISQITGFSPATVSNALNHKRGVNGETAEKIFQAAERLGYRADRTISKLRFVTYRKNGQIIDDSQIFPAMIEGVERQAKAMGYETTFSHLNYCASDFEDRLREVTDDTSSLVILLGTEMLDEDYKFFMDYRGYLIILDGWCEDMAFDAVLINNTDAAANAIEYLIKKGHKEIGYLRGGYRIKSFQYREYGYYRTLAAHNYPKNPEYIVTLGTRIETAYVDMKYYLEGEPELPTAFFADNDIIALGAIRALEEKGIRIPEQVSIVGFDDIHFGAVSGRGLTTIHVFKQEMGEVAVRRAMDHIKYPGRMVKTKIQVGTEFLERGSVRDIK
ncbi:LacI family DNA-binding transcriptional regulator [Muricomes intestini]|uniref:LacI family transcriptional regulator n=1 Tax=Muricomes intestini TaxID=1796634 RepID=A0A4R3KDM2_9FIRM|nr:LacI family DNA-binding transcriptional regulator [Muricomes intestini]TCS81150.1 LacI family transcriptional regulator [Muricomes intestini]HAX52068.1 LacI family transcriptional regulator [Lachnospiraceae bacterium]HCR83958.1 LacI family transcriptional regulator [Lachnospiraceae bacterium]